MTQLTDEAYTASVAKRFDLLRLWLGLQSVGILLVGALGLVGSGIANGYAWLAMNGRVGYLYNEGYIFLKKTGGQESFEHWTNISDYILGDSLSSVGNLWYVLSLAMILTGSVGMAVFHFIRLKI